MYNNDSHDARIKYVSKKAGQKVLKQLNEVGYVAYFVGGMVHDTLLDRDAYLI